MDNSDKAERNRGGRIASDIKTVLLSTHFVRSAVREPAKGERTARKLEDFFADIPVLDIVDGNCVLIPFGEADGN